MPINSSNQTIDIRYKSEVTSTGVNKRIRDVFGSKGKLLGLNLSPVSGRNCQLSIGRFILDGATVEELEVIPVTIPANTSGVTKSYYVYAFYAHANGAVCSYDVLEATTSLETALLLSTVTIPSGTSTITTGHISNAPLAAKSRDAVVFTDRATKEVEAVNKITVGSVSVVSGSVTPVGSSTITFHGNIRAGTIYGTLGSDYAEYFERGGQTEPGDVIALNPDSFGETYVRADENHQIIVGVQAEQPGMIIGGDGEENILDRYIPVALAGRVPVKVYGLVSKGDYLQFDPFYGHVESVGKNPLNLRLGMVIGVALEEKPTYGYGKVKCLIRQA